MKSMMQMYVTHTKPVCVLKQGMFVEGLVKDDQYSLQYSASHNTKWCSGN